MAHKDSLGNGETPQVHTWSVVRITAGTIIALILATFFLALAFRDRIHEIRIHPRSFPAPGVTSAEKAERLHLEAEQRKLLNGADGRMPIEKAMQAIAARGNHAFDPADSSP